MFHILFSFPDQVTISSSIKASSLWLFLICLGWDAQCSAWLPKSGYSKWEKTTKSKQSALWCNEIYYPNNKIYLYYTTNKLYHEPFNTLHTKTLYTSSIYSRFIWGVALRSCIWLVETSLFFCHFTHLSRAYSLCRNYHQMPLSILY